MTLVTLPYRTELSAGQAEDIGMVLADLDAILAVVNGDLRNDNFAAGAALSLTKMAITGTPDGTKFLRDDSSWQPVVGSEWKLIGDSLLAADGTFDFQSIPATFRHLQAFAYLRSDQAATVDATRIRFNNDATANYDSYGLFFNGTTPSITGTENLGATAMVADQGTVGNSAAVGLWSALVFSLPHYAGANNKIMEVLAGLKWGIATNNQRVVQSSCNWRSNAAVNRVTFLPSGGTNFKAGSRVTLYGV